MKSQCAIDEQETTINLFPGGTNDNLAEVYSSMPHIVKKLKKLKSAHPDLVAVKEDGYYIFAKVPREWIKIQPKRANKMTDEQKAATRERLAAAKLAKQEADKNGSS